MPLGLSLSVGRAPPNRARRGDQRLASEAPAFPVDPSALDTTEDPSTQVSRFDPADEDCGDAVTALTDLAIAAHAHSASVSSYRARIRTAAGREEDVEILHAGAIAYFYADVSIAG